MYTPGRDPYQEDPYYQDPRPYRPPPPPQPYGPPSRFEPPPPKPWIRPIISIVIAIILLIISISVSWWHIEYEIREYNGVSEKVILTYEFQHDEIDAEIDYTSTSDSPSGIEDDEETLDWDEFRNWEGEDCDHMEELFGWIYLLTIITVLLAIGAIVLITIGGMRFISFKIAWAVCLALVLISIIAPLYFALGIKGVCAKDDYPMDDGTLEIQEGLKLGPINFITMDSGSKELVSEDPEEEGFIKAEMSTYPNIGWILAVVAIICLTLAFAQANIIKDVVGPPRYGYRQSQQGYPGYYDRRY